MQWIKSSKLAIYTMALLIPCMEIDFWGAWFEVFWMCLFKNLSKFFQKLHFLQNPGFRSLQVKKTHIWHFHSCFLVFSYHISIIQKENFECILPRHLFCIFEWCESDLYLNYKQSFWKLLHCIPWHQFDSAFDPLGNQPKVVYWDYIFYFFLTIFILPFLPNWVIKSTLS